MPTESFDREFEISESQLIELLMESGMTDEEIEIYLGES